MDYNSFYFRGPEDKLNLKAYNLMIFIQIASGVDDETWLYHLQRKDYSNWLRNSVHDKELADLVDAVENDEKHYADSRQMVLEIDAVTAKEV